MKTISQLAQDVTSEAPLTPAEQLAELATARQIVGEALKIGGHPATLSHRITITMGPQLTSTMGKARYSTQTIRLSASPLWRRASPKKRRNTVVHELAHLLTRKLHPRAAAHGREWKSVMAGMGESPKRCHSVPTVQTSRRSSRRPTSADFLAQILGRRSASPANAAAVTERVQHRASFRVGDVVMFGKGRGEQTRARVERVNGKSLSLVTLEARGYDRHPAGSKFRASYALVRKVS
jgi:hypothetical protein